MGLLLQVTCSHHQKNDGGYGKEVDVAINTLDDLNRERVRKWLEAKGWVVEFNGDNMDTYCSKKCAE